MTSSLVGSEMCIRDSTYMSEMPVDCAMPRNIRNAAQESMADITEAFPVSYTHLTLPTICSV
eukprot:6294663-Prorocentrum_lima.AAC.1